MRHPVLQVLTLILASSACLLFAAACGDDDDTGREPTLESYFTRLETIFADFAETGGTLEGRYPRVFDDLDDTQAYYPDLLGEMQPTFADIAALEAPAEIAPQHQALVEATRDFYDGVSRVNAEVQALGESELAEYVTNLRTDPAMTLATTSVADACHALQDLADENNIDVDLLCGEASDPAENAILAHYFAAVQGIFERADTSTQAAQADLDSALAGASFEGQKDAISAYLTSVEGTFTDTINRLRGLGSPEPVQATQNQFIGAVEDMLEASSSFQTNLATIADAPHLDARRADFGEEISAAVERADAACRQLQRIAEGRDIDVDLGCAP